MTSPAIIILRLFHLLGALFWGGGLLLLAAFVFPSVGALGVGGRPMMQQLTQVRRLPAYLTGAMLFTVLSGIELYRRDSAGFQLAWIGSGPGIGFTTGALLGIIAAALGVLVNKPTADRLGKIGAVVQSSGQPPTPEQAAEMQRLQARLTKAINGAAVLLILATAAMAVARYLP